MDLEHGDRRKHDPLLAEHEMQIGRQAFDINPPVTRPFTGL